MRGSALKLWMPIAAALVALAFAIAAPAWSCSSIPPPHIDDIAPGEPIPELTGSTAAGVYEQEHIAGSPGLVFISPRTVSVVTRYWGTPPAHLGPQMHGEGLGIFGVSSCGNQAGTVGLIGYNWVDRHDLDIGRDPHRPLPSIDIRPSLDGFTETTTGVLTEAQEADLTRRFGEPKVVLISAKHRFLANLMAWQYHIIALGFVAGLLAIFVFRMQTRRPAANAAGEAQASNDKIM
ncbi:MAG: hypothetical protein ABFR53_01690 [Actinomycetota bacterium]